MIATVTSLEWYRRHFLVMSLLLLLPLSLCGNELFEGKHNNIYSMRRPCSLQISMHVIILIGKLTFAPFIDTFCKKETVIFSFVRNCENTGTSRSANENFACDKYLVQSALLNSNQKYAEFPTNSVGDTMYKLSVGFSMGWQCGVCMKKVEIRLNYKLKEFELNGAH